LAATAASLALPQYLRRHAKERPTQVAVIDGATDESVTYAELLTRVQSLAAGLRSVGLDAGSRVGIVALNSLRYVELLWALAELGAIAVPLNLRLNPVEAAANLADAGATAIVADATMAPMADAILARTDIPLRLTLAAEREGWTSLASLRVEGGRVPEQVSGETIATLLFTSGTTGRAKGCELRQRTWTGYAMNMAATIRMGPTDVYLAFLPYFHVAGLGTLLSQMCLGGTVVTWAVADPAKMIGLIERHRVTIVFVVPGISGPFLDSPALAQHDVSSVRLLISGAGMERPGIADQVAERLGAEYVAIYGQTESGTKITWATAEQVRANPRTYGSVMPGLAFRIVDADDQDVPEGQPGELVIRGGTVMAGYWNQPEASAETLRGGWHHTGDTFVHDGGGMLRMIDRTKYLIKTGGENVYPLEVENALRTHADVADVAVIGIPDPEWGETVKAFVVPTAGATPERSVLADWVRTTIAGYKAPRFIEFIDAIPRNESGKVLKHPLAERATAEDQRVPARGAH
jgi:acyl-CoA synthetase (AMP-forming)/AMP-acid ligase II